MPHENHPQESHMKPDRKRGRPQKGFQLPPADEGQAGHHGPHAWLGRI